MLRASTSTTCSFHFAEALRGALVLELDRHTNLLLDLCDKQVHTSVHGAMLGPCLWSGFRNSRRSDTCSASTWSQVCGSSSTFSKDSTTSFHRSVCLARSPYSSRCGLSHLRAHRTDQVIMSSRNGFSKCPRPNMLEHVDWTRLTVFSGNHKSASCGHVHNQSLLSVLTWILLRV